MAQYIWMNIEPALKTELGDEVKLDLDMLFTAKQLVGCITNFRWRIIRSFTGEGLATIMVLYYRRENWLSDKNVYNMIWFRMRNNVAIRTGKMPSEEEMYRKTGI